LDKSLAGMKILGNALAGSRHAPELYIHPDLDALETKFADQQLNYLHRTNQ
jgi:hypothetical protein